MNVLVVGAAGKVGSILRPALEREHHCHYYDLNPVPGAESRTTLGDVNDEAAMAGALDGRDAVVYLAMGYGSSGRRSVNDINAAFDVNLRGWYRTLHIGLERGVRRWVYASSLSVYQNYRQPRTDESRPADAWDPYGFSKRLAEHVCAAAAQHDPQAVILALRLIMPYTEAERPALRKNPDRAAHAVWFQAPEDMRRLFLAALACDKPGCHIVQTTGDLTGNHLPNTRATELLGWAPRESLG